MYGVATYRRWGSVHQVLVDYYNNNYALILVNPTPTPTPDLIFSDDDGTVADNSQEDPPIILEWDPHGDRATTWRIHWSTQWTTSTCP